MFTFGNNDDDELSNGQNKNENITLVPLIEEKHVIGNKNKNKAHEKKAIHGKENNIDNSNVIIQDAKKLKFNPINLGKEKKTKALLGKKRNPDKTTKQNIFLGDERKENIKQNEKVEKFKVIKKGRRRKDVEYDSESKNGKFREDNIIKRIKKNIFDYIVESLNKSLIDDTYEFYPLSKEFISDLKKDFNEKMFDRTICDIFKNSKLGKKYINMPDLNKTLIKKIYDENTEIETKKILEKKLKDILNYIREKDMDYFLNKIRNKEAKKNQQIDESYMKAVKKLLIKYEFWFKIKITKGKGKKSKQLK